MLRSAIAQLLSPFRRAVTDGARSPTVVPLSIQFPKFALEIQASDYGGRMYNERAAFEEAQSLLYRVIQTDLAPTCVVDVGANYGFTALIFAHAFPSAHIFAVEPSPALVPFLQRNLAQIPSWRVTTISAACGAEARERIDFGLNPHSSQDNRMVAQSGWDSVGIRQTTVDEIVSAVPSSSPLFIKIDTQGFDLKVFMGAETTLSRCPHWLAKTEFAPFCLTSQGTDPEECLRYLISRYKVVESPARLPFGSSRLSELFSRPLNKQDIPSFVRHVRELNRNDTGWLDLLVCPRTMISDSL